MCAQFSSSSMKVARFERIRKERKNFECSQSFQKNLIHNQLGLFRVPKTFSTLINHKYTSNKQVIERTYWNLIFPANYVSFFFRKLSEWTSPKMPSSLRRVYWERFTSSRPPFHSLLALMIRVWPSLCSVLFYRKCDIMIWYDIQIFFN